jgi:hypothetical protein
MIWFRNRGLIGSTRTAKSLRTCVVPVFQRIHDVPPVLIVVADVAAEDDPGATRRQRQRIPRTDLCSAECSTSLGETHAPATSASGTHSGDAAGDRDVQLPGAHMVLMQEFRLSSECNSC